MQYLATHLAQTLIVLGLLLLAIEVVVLGLSTFVLFFLGIGSIATGGLISIGLIPENVLYSLLSTAIIASLIAIFSWKPMKRMQNKVEITQVDNDMIGHQFTLTKALLPGKTVTHRYSGINWQVQATDTIPAGAQVKIINMEVGLLTVKQVD